MDRWKGRVALVTGASAGIGAAVAKELVRKGMKVIGMARRVDRIEAFQAELKGASGKLYPLAGDVSKEDDILAVFEWAKKNLGGVDVLINSAGLASVKAQLTRAETEIWKGLVDVNVIGLSICSREAVKSMQERGVNDGHIININSVNGHRIMKRSGNGMYAATKFAVTALTQALKKELIALNSRIKVTSLSPGAVKTDFAIAAGGATDHSRYDSMPHLEANDLVLAVVFILGCPENVQINEMIIEAVGEDI